MVDYHHISHDQHIRFLVLKLKRRIFIGLPVTIPVTDRLLSASTRLANEKELEHFRWHRAEKLHLTLSFIGALEEEKIQQIALSLQEALIPAIETEILITHIDWFPPESKPRLVAAYVERTEALLALQHRVSNALETIGIMPEKKRYLPHITLGRHGNNKQKSHLPDFDIKTSYVADRVIGYESKMTEQGSEYISLFEVPLVKSAF